MFWVSMCLLCSRMISLWKYLFPQFIACWHQHNSIDSIYRGNYRLSIDWSSQRMTHSVGRNKLILRQGCVLNALFESFEKQIWKSVLLPKTTNDRHSNGTILKKNFPFCWWQILTIHWIKCFSSPLDSKKSTHQVTTQFCYM